MSYKVWATFRGYSGTLRTLTFREKFTDDEWLCDLYTTESAARAAVEEFGGGKRFDNPQETQITRFYKGGKTIFEHGEETEAPVRGGFQEWMRYTSMVVKEPEEKTNYKL